MSLQLKSGKGRRLNPWLDLQGISSGIEFVESLYSQILLISDIDLWGTVSHCVQTVHVLTASESSIGNVFCFFSRIFVAQRTFCLKLLPFLGGDM